MVGRNGNESATKIKKRYITSVTPFETILITAIGTAIVGFAGFLTWLVKYLLPEIVETWKKSQAKFSENVDKISASVAQFPATIQSLQAGVDTSNQLGRENKVDIQKLREDIFDKKFQDLSDKVTHISNKDN